MTFVECLPYAGAMGLGIFLIFIIYALATKKSYAEKLLLGWFIMLLFEIMLQVFFN